MSRSISHSEISTALTCEARHAFAYTGHLTEGQTLHPRATAPILSNGRAWGAAVAAWHAFPNETNLFAAYRPSLARMAAHAALRASYEQDVDEQGIYGVLITPETQVLREESLGRILDHYMATALPLENLTRLEGEIDIPIPSRTGKRASTRYRFNGFIDGFTRKSNGTEWIVEFKLRTSLTAADQINLSRQIRYYAWARQQETGVPVVGALVDERLADAPKPPRIVKAKRKGEGINGYVPSEAKDQMCRPEDYIAVCQEFDVEPNLETIAALEARVWQRRHPVMFTARELEEAGRELVSAAMLIRDLDSGERYPIRNTQPQLCRGCKFKAACPNPGDRLFLSTLFEFTDPKRLRPKRELASDEEPSLVPESEVGSLDLETVPF